jgi:predicted nucleic acid-binding protein
VIVLDASAIIEFLLLTKSGKEIEQRIYSSHETLHAPELLSLEVIQVLRRMVLRKEIEGRRADDAISDLLNLRVSLYPHKLLVPRIWQLRHNLSAYDAAYIALAESLRAPIVTRDTGLKAASGHVAVVEVF